MKTIILSISVFTFLLFNAVAQQTDYSQLRNDAEAEYARGSYARANDLYAKGLLAAGKHTILIDW